MQLREEKFTLNHRLNDGKMYLLLFLGALLFTTIGIYLFIIPLSSSFSSHFPDVAGYLRAGYPDSRIIYENIFGIASVVPQVVAYIFFVCISIIIAPNIYILDYKKTKSDFLKFIILVVVFSIVMYVTNLITNIIYILLGNTSTSANQLAIYGMLNSSASAVTVLLVVVLAPIVEELIFRKFLFGFFNETLHLNDWLAMICSAIVFALIHVSSSVSELVYFPMYFVMALALVGAYVVSKKNIYVTICVHIINNLVSVLAWMMMN